MEFVATDSDKLFQSSPKQINEKPDLSPWYNRYSFNNMLHVELVLARLAIKWRQFLPKEN